jgi:DNA-binding LacI/PurR family transcriptional regulator
LGKQPTFRDVARAAKVSPATVSRVARDNPTVDANIRNRVRAAAARLGVVMGEKRGDGGHMLAFLLSNRDVLHGFHAKVLVGAENYCARMNWELAFMSFRYSPEVGAKELHLPQMLAQRTVARAAILAGVNYPNLLEALQAREIPFAVLGNNIVGEWPADRYDVVYSGDIQGACEITQRLIAFGHRQICFIGDVHLPWFARCAQGYREAMAEAGLEPRITGIHSDGEELGYLGTKCVLAEPVPVTAIFAGSDQVARGVYTALRESNIPIPEAMSVVGFNDTEAALFHPPLSSVREFPDELGQHLADFTLKRMEEPERPAQRLTIPTQVVMRESVRRI